jgi:hypothetical protein
LTIYINQLVMLPKPAAPEGAQREQFHSPCPALQVLGSIGAQRPSGGQVMDSVQSVTSLVVSAFGIFRIAWFHPSSRMSGAVVPYLLVSLSLSFSSLCEFEVEHNARGFRFGHTS